MWPLLIAIGIGEKSSDHRRIYNPCDVPISRRFYSPQTWDARLTSGPPATSCHLLACCKRPVSNLVRSCASLTFYVACIERLVASL